MVHDQSMRKISAYSLLDQPKLIVNHIQKRFSLFNLKHELLVVYLCSLLIIYAIRKSKSITFENLNA